MKKKVLLRALLGAPIGLSIGFLVTLLVSAGFGDGKFYPVTPELTALCGTELLGGVGDIVFEFGATYAVCGRVRRRVALDFGEFLA